MKNANFKPIIILIVIFVIYILTFFLVFSGKNQGSTQKKSDNNKTESTINYSYMLINNTSNWRYYKGTWSSFDPSNFNNNKKTFKVYNDCKFLGNYYLSHANVWDVYDSSENFVGYSGNLFAVSTDLNYTPVSTQTREMTSDEIDLVKTNMGIKNIGYMSEKEAVDVDLDHNGIMDKIIIVSNVGSEEVEEKFFNVIYVVLNNNMQKLVEDNIASKDSLSSISYNFSYIINDGTGKDGIIVGYRYCSEGNPGSTMFLYQNGKYQKVYSDYK